MKNIVLCCAAGMSTSMLVQRMKDAAQKKGCGHRHDGLRHDER